MAPKIYAATIFLSGQACIAIKRLYVHESTYDAVCDELGRLARATVVGDGLEPGTRTTWCSAVWIRCRIASIRVAVRVRGQP